MLLTKKISSRRSTADLATVVCFAMENHNETRQEIKTTKWENTEIWQYLTFADSCSWMNTNWFGTTWKTGTDKVMNEWWKNHPCRGRMSLAAWVLQFPHVLTSPGCVVLSDNVHRCVALKINSVRRTVKFKLKAQNVFMLQFTSTHEAPPKTPVALDILCKMYLEKIKFQSCNCSDRRKLIPVKKSRVCAIVALQIWFLRHKKLWEKEIVSMPCMNDFFLFDLRSPKAEDVKTRFVTELPFSNTALTNVCST